jgi:CBS domain-containing protein
MFSVYGVTGPVFRGTLEELKRVNVLDKVRPLRSITREGSESGGVANISADKLDHENAVHAYLAMLPDEIERGPLYHAAQIMQRQVITVSDDDNVAQAWRILHDNNIHQAPVLKGNGQLVGIVSERNLLTAIDVDAGKMVENIKQRVRDVMTTPVATAAPVTDIRRIAAVMLDNSVGGTPITNEIGHLVGFVSRGDILRAVVKEPPLSLWR